MLSGRGLCDELITRPEKSYRLCCVVVCYLETSRMGAPYIYDLSRLRVNYVTPTITFTSTAFLAHRIFVSHNKTTIINLNNFNRFVFAMFMYVLSTK